jgi:hypothetical protein
MKKRYRTILPSPEQFEPPPNAPPGSVDETVDQGLPKKRRNIRVACNNCRVKRTAVGQLLIMP